MPITAKLSHKLYETFGDEAAGEMIDWMQRVDVQRAELRELNELTVSRLEARLGEVRSEIQAQLTDLRRDMETGFARQDGARIELEKKMETGFARLETRIEQRTVDIMKWSFVFWVGSVVTVVGAMVALARFLP